MKIQNLNEYLPREPRNISKTTWFYLESKGIDLVFEERQNEKYIGTFQVVIPWRMVEKAIIDYKKAKLKQK